MEINNPKIVITADATQAEGAFDRLKGATMGLMRELGMLQGALSSIGIAAGLAGFGAMVQKSIEAKAQLYQLSEAVGVSVESLSSLKRAASLEGVGIEDMAKGMAKLQKAMLETARGGGDAKKAFDELNLSVTQGGRLKEADKMLLELAVKLDGMSNTTQRNAYAQAILGKNYLALMPVLKNIAEEGLDAARVTTEQTAAADHFEKTMIRAKAAGMQWANAFTSAMIPALESIATGFKTFGILYAEWWVVFVAAPPVIAAVATAWGTLQLQLALAGAEIKTGTGALAVMNTALWGTQVALLSVKTVLGSLFALIAGYQFGTWLSENFTEARLAGNLMVQNLLVGWESLKYGFETALNGMAGLWYGFIQGLGDTLQKIPGFGAAGKVLSDQGSAGLRQLAADQKAAKAAYEGEVASIKAIIDQMGAEEIARGSVAKAAKKQRKEVELGTDQQTESLTDAQNAYNRVREAAILYNAELNEELSAGAKLTRGEKMLVDARSQLTPELYKQIEAYLKLNIEREKSVAINAEIAKAKKEQIDTLNKDTAALIAETEKMRDHNFEIIFGKSALEARKIAQDESTLASLQSRLESIDATKQCTAEGEAIRTQIAAMKDRNAVRAETITANNLKQQMDEWKRFTDDIDRALTDALMRGFENGKGGAQAFIDSLKNSLKSAVFKIAVKAVLDPVTGTLQGLMGGGSAATSQGLFGTTGGLSTLQAGGSLYNFATGNVSGGAYGAFAQSSVGTSLGLSNPAYFANAELGTAAELTGGGLTGLGTAVPYIGAAIAAISVISSLMGKGGGPKTEGDYASLLNKTGGIAQSSSVGGIGGMGDWYTGHSADTQMAQMSTALGGGIASLIKSLGGNAAGIGMHVGYNTDPAGTAPDNFSAQINNAKGEKVYGNGGDVARGGAGAQMELEAKRMTLASVKAAEGIDKLFTDIVDGIDLAKASSTELDAALTKLSDVMVIKKEFEALGWNIASLTTSLIDAAGGTANLQAGISTYYDNFYSDAEKQKATWAALSTQLSAIGITLPDATNATREWFRAQMEMPGITDATKAALLGMSGAFASVTAATTAATAAVVDNAASLKAAADLKRTNDNLLVTQYELEGKAADALVLRRALETEGMATSTLAIQNRIYTLKDEAVATQAAADAAAALAAINATRQGWQDQLDVLTGAKTQQQIDRQNTLAGTTDATTKALMNQVFQQQDLATSAAAAKTALATQQQAVSSFWGSVAQGFADSYKKQEEALKSTITQMDGFTASLQKFQNTLGSGSLSGGSIFDQYASANQQFVATSQAASFGNTDAISELPSIIQTFLAASKAIATDATAYALDVGRASNSLGSAMNYTSGMSAQAQSSLTGLPAAQNAAMQAFAAAVRKTMPGYASGGDFGGGVRLVGESGPEIEFTGPSRITSNADSKKLLDLAPLLAEISALKRVVAAQSATLTTIAQGTTKTADTLDGCTGGGGPMLVQTA